MQTFLRTPAQRMYTINTSGTRQISSHFMTCMNRCMFYTWSCSNHVILSHTHTHRAEYSILYRSNPTRSAHRLLRSTPNTLHAAIIVCWLRSIIKRPKNLICLWGGSNLQQRERVSQRLLSGPRQWRRAARLHRFHWSGSYCGGRSLVNSSTPTLGSRCHGDCSWLLTFFIFQS